MNDLNLAIMHQSPSQGILRRKTDALASGGAENTVTELKRAAQEFASFLYLEVLKAMRATLPKDGLFENDSLSRDIYSSMFDGEVARVLAKRDAEGFTGIVERAIEKVAPISRTSVPDDKPVDSAAPSGFDTRDDRFIAGTLFTLA
jgi:Rod binding domain-containing protein